MQATVSEKGQVTIPVALREQLGIHPGSRLAFHLTPQGTLNVSVLARGSQGLSGLLKREGEAPRTLQQMDAAITTTVGQRARRK